MKKLSIYLDTSVINFLFADDAPEKKAVTEVFFEKNIKRRTYNVYVSPVVVDEINKTNDAQKRIMLLGIIQAYEIPILEIEDLTEVEKLARLYIDGGIIPEKKFEDALHIAIATVKSMDILLSWNYRHLANINKEALIQAINIRMGYRNDLRMITPYEVLYE